MTTIIDSSSAINISELMKYILNDSIESSDSLESMFDKVDTEPTQKNIHKDHTYHLNHALTEKTCTTPILHTLTAKVRRTKIQPYCKKPSELKKEMEDDINRLREKTKKSLKKIQMTYADKLNVDIQTVEKIYSAVPLFFPSVQKASEIKIIDPLNTLPSEWLVPPESKKEMVDGINRIFQRTKSSLEEIQTYYANKLNVDIQDIKNIYSASCLSCPTALTTSKIKTRAFNNFP